MSQTHKIFVGADSFLRDSWRLAAAVRESGWRPDWLVALWRGGALAGMAVHEFLKVSGWNLRHAPLKCSSYAGLGENTGKVSFSLEEPFFAMFRPGEKVLVVDDVFDTGRTAEAVKKRFAAAGCEARFAAVYWKPEKNETQTKPDWHVRDAGGDWIVFPHEIEGLSADEIRRKDPELGTILEKMV